MEDHNTYFTNRMAPASEINAALHACRSNGFVAFCTPQPIRNTSLSKIVIRWKSPHSTTFLQGSIAAIDPTDSPSGAALMANLAARPWSDLSQHTEGSVITITDLQITDPHPSVADLTHIQSCKYVTT